MIVANLTQNAQTAQQVIAAAVERLPLRAHLRVRLGAKYAIITRPEAVPRDKRELAPLVGKYLSSCWSSWLDGCELPADQRSGFAAMSDRDGVISDQ